MGRSNFTEADLGGANLSKAELQRSVMLGANLVGANLTGADLARVNLLGAKLAGPICSRAVFLTRVEGVDLSQAQGLTQAQLDSACGDTKTVLPKGLKTPARWPCPKDD